MHDHCGGCGFFCLELAGSYQEADENYRNGRIEHACIKRKRSISNPLPCCRLAKADICAEVLAGENYLRVINKPRTCGEFEKLVPGHGPDTFLMLREMSVERLRTELQSGEFDWQKEQAALSNRFAQQIAALEETRHQEGKQIATWQLWVAIGLGLAGLAVGIAGILKQPAPIIIQQPTHQSTEDPAADP